MPVTAENLVGIRFGRWVVLYQQESTPANKNGNSRRTVWRTRCDCGKERSVLGQSLRNRSSQSCGCLHHERLAKRVTKSFGQSAKLRVITTYKGSAKRRQLQFRLSDNEFLILTQQSCHYCGDKPRNKSATAGGEFIYNGIDRKDSSIGYEMENVVPCCAVCNRAKGDLSYDEFVAWIHRVKHYDVACTSY